MDSIDVRVYNSKSTNKGYMHLKQYHMGLFCHPKCQKDRSGHNLANRGWGTNNVLYCRKKHYINLSRCRHPIALEFAFLKFTKKATLTSWILKCSKFMINVSELLELHLINQIPQQLHFFRNEIDINWNFMSLFFFTLTQLCRF